MAHDIKLIKATEPYAPAAESFEDGERVILVDGVRWGRTLVHRHGPLGLSVRFVQDGVRGVIYRDSSSARTSNQVVLYSKGHSADARAALNELVLLTIRELIATERLRDPDQTDVEEARLAARYAARVQASIAVRDKAFRARARAANRGPKRSRLNRIVAAMDWARRY